MNIYDGKLRLPTNILKIDYGRNIDAVSVRAFVYIYVIRVCALHLFVHDHGES